MMNCAWIGLGANLDAPQTQCVKALELLDRHPGCAIIAASNLYLTEPVGAVIQPWFVNAVAGVHTGLSPWELWQVCAGIERSMGRVRAVAQGPRLIDLDVLLYNDQVITMQDLIVPHPRLHERRFVLQPLVDVLPTGRHPATGERYCDLLNRPNIQIQAIRMMDSHHWYHP